MSANAITLGDIRSADWSLMLDSPGMPGSGLGKVVQGLDDVNQCIAIILTTPRGSDPLRPTFAADLWRYIDYPIASAVPAIVREATEAITLWEPRVTVLSVSAQIITAGAQAQAHLQATVRWQLRLSAAPSVTGATTVALPAA